MASNRHLGRIIALQTLYERDFRCEAGDESFDLEEVLERNITRYQKMVDDKDFIEALVRGVVSQEAELDAQLQPIAPEWPIDQIARMDRVVLRMGLYELSQTTNDATPKDGSVPPKVVINEAVELAKSFGGENSSKFINGVLGTVMRQRDPKTDLADDTVADLTDDTAADSADGAMAGSAVAPADDTSTDDTGNVIEKTPPKKPKGKSYDKGNDDAQNGVVA